MTNPAGGLWETTLEKYLLENQIQATRLVRRGAKDEGDLLVWKNDTPFIVEAKAVKRIDLASFIEQAEVEAGNYSARTGVPVEPIAIIKRRNHRAGKAYVVSTVDRFFGVGQ
jgi:hypothetical protein